ncbi:MAG: nuclear transport factor 2 family protein, partial [bacterium]
MTDQEMLMIERHCERLITRYCHYIDHGEAAKVADLFTADGTWTAPGVVMSGQDELRTGFTSRQENTARMSRHVCNNLLIDVIDADHAHGAVYLT